MKKFHKFREQRRSETFRPGEPSSHLDAKFITNVYLHKKGYECYEEYPFKSGQYRHQYDLAAFTLGDSINVPEHDGNTTNFSLKYLFAQLSHPNDLYTYQYKNLIDKKIKILVEVDDPELHSKITKKINDGVAESHAQENYPWAKFVRLNKKEIRGTPERRLAYFIKELDPYL
jgi:hypothetical protein